MEKQIGGEGMSETQDGVNVQEIMAKIRAEIEKKGFARDDGPFSAVQVAYDDENCDDILATLHDLSSILVFHPIKTRGGVAGKISFAFKRLMRKLISFALVPMAQQETYFNHAASDCIIALHASTVASQERISILEQELTRMHGLLNECKNNKAEEAPGCE